MSIVSISKTSPNTTKYPLHQHLSWEIMYYLSGEGFLATEQKDIHFKKGTIIVVPPKTVHGSRSKKDFVNIAIRGNFKHYFNLEQLFVLQDNPLNDGGRLVNLIYENYNSNVEYLSALFNAFIQFLFKNIGSHKKTNIIINNIKQQVLDNFHNPNFNITQLLNESGYSEDYIRSIFKTETEMTPLDFLAKIRIEHARNLLEIYGQNITVSEVSEACGFDDSVYFSRRFKQFTGFSPSEFRNRNKGT